MPKLCVVGAGRWGQNHVRTLHELGYLAALVDADSGRTAEFAKQIPGLTVYATLEEALAQDYDGYTVATPAHTHFAIASKILRARKPVLVEKPLALSSREARELEALALEFNQQLMVGHLLLFHPAIEKMKELIEADKVGKLQYIYSNRINLGTVRTEENILWSFAPHDISIFQYFLQQQPLEVVSRGGAYLQPGIHDTTMTTLVYPDNVICHNFVSWLHPFKEHRLVVIGSKGMLSFDDAAEMKPLKFYEKGIDWINGEPIKRDGPTEEIAYAQGQPLTEELRYFANNLNGTIERANARSAVEVLEVLERASACLVDSDSPSGGEHSADTVHGHVDPTAVLHSGVFVHDTGFVDAQVTIGENTKLWHFCHVQQNSKIGSQCSFGQNVNVGSNVTIGNGVKVQNNVSIFEGVEIEDHVFCGPSMTFTNVLTPRAKYPTGVDGYSKTLVKTGASLGAKSVVVCGNTVGRHAMVGAGAVITKDVPDYALMLGVPAQQVGWVSEGGERIALDFEGVYRCATSGKSFQVLDHQLVEVAGST